MDITAYRGQRRVLGFTLTGQTITGWTILLTCRAAATEDSPVLFTAVGNVTDGPAGKFDVVLTAVNTDMAPGQYQFDVWRTDVANPGPIYPPSTLTIKGSIYKP